MPFAIKQLISRGYYAPAGDDGADGGGGSAPEADRGDSIEPITDNMDAPADPDAPADAPADPDVEGAETEDEKAERERAEAEETRKKNIRIPKTRFDEALGKAKAREAALLDEIEKLRGGQQANATHQAIDKMRATIDELQDKYEDMILDGRKEEARKTRKNIEELRDQLTDYQTSVKSDAARRGAVEELTYNAQLANLESRYPALNPDHVEFDEHKIAEVSALMKAFTNAGEPRAQALNRAVHYAMGAAPAPAQQSGKPADPRAPEARKKAAEADRQQPPSAKAVGLDSDRGGRGTSGDIDVMRLDQRKFAKLDEDTLAKLRGDTI